MDRVHDLYLKHTTWVKIKKLHEDAVIPEYAKHGDAGMDLTAVSIEVDNYGNVSYGTGLAMEIPFDHVGLIFPRSSISKYKLDLANAVGVIDSGYRGEIICKFKPTPMFTNNAELNSKLLDNNEMYEIGDRVAQIIIMPLPHVTFHEVKELSNTDRGDGGFGSSGN